MYNTKQNDEGRSILLKALNCERDARIYYGKYVRWVKDNEVLSERIVEDLMEILGWTRAVSRNRAPLIICLGREEFKPILEDLITGNIAFAVALERVKNQGEFAEIKASVANAQPMTDEEFAVYQEKQASFKAAAATRAANRAADKAEAEAAQATAQATKAAPKPSNKMEDQEEAQKCIERGITIMMKLHEEWSQAEMMLWLTNLYTAITKR